MYTPDGHKYDPQDPQTLEQCWIQPDSFPNLVQLATNPMYAQSLNAYIIVACAEVNRICNRKFNAQTVDEIFHNVRLNLNEYQDYVLKNDPLNEVINVWLEVVNTFSVIDPQFFQVDTSVGLLKILPTFTVYTQTTLPNYRLESASNLWIRYNGGFEVDYSDANNPVNNVPMAVRMATAMMVNYLIDTMGLTGGISNFRTQTYSQQNARPEEDPKYQVILNMLREYRHIKLA